MSYQTCKASTWCPGCGNYGILGAMKTAFKNLQIEPHKLVMTYDVGCSGNMADFVFCYGFHSLHGRALATAAGIKLANHELDVISIIGDGGCFGEGLGHFVEMARGNHDIVVIVHDNSLYSLTTGQKSPTTSKGEITPSTPSGVIDQPINPIELALVSGASFVARGFAGDLPHLTSLIEQAIQHKGFSLVDILQPCITYGHKKTPLWYRERVVKLEDQSHDKNNYTEAIAQAKDEDKLPIGVFYQNKRKTYHEQVHSLNKRPLVISPIDKIDITSDLQDYSV